MKKIIISFVILFSNSLIAKPATDCDDVSQFKDLTITEMKSIVRKGSATIIDVNSDSSFKKSHIPKAIHYSTNKDKFKDILPKDKSAMIIAYCGGKLCTAWERAAKAACKLGYSNIRHFSEGISGWEKNI